MSGNSSHKQPPGETQPSSGPEDLAIEVYCVGAICLAAISLSAGLRWYAGRYILQTTRDGYKKHDYAFAAALLAGISYTCLVIALYVGPPFGKHIQDVKPRDFSSGKFELFAAVELLYQPFIWLIKLSLYLMLLEIFGGLKWMRYCVWGGLSVTGLFTIAAVVVEGIVCFPKYGLLGKAGQYWRVFESSVGCHKNSAPSAETASINLADDIFLLILPLPAIWSLQLSTRKKVGVSAMFLIGIVACSCNAMQLYAKVTIGDNPDFTYNSITLMVPSMLEMMFGLLIPCTPAIATVYRHHSPWAKSLAKDFRDRLFRRKSVEPATTTSTSLPSTTWTGTTPVSYIVVSAPDAVLTRSHSDDSDSSTAALRRLGSHEILMTTEVTVRPGSIVEHTAPQLRALDWERTSWD